MSEIARIEEASAETSVCQHGNNPAECDACLFQQPAWKTIEKLQAESSYKRSNETSPVCTIEFEGKKYTIETIERGDDPALHEVQELFENTFSKEEVEPEETLKHLVDGVTEWGTETRKWKIVAIRDESGKLVSTIENIQLDLLDEAGKPTGEAVHFTGYEVTDKNFRQRGLAREAYISSLIGATHEASARGQKLKFAIGECTYTSEKFWNKVGWRRIYGMKDNECKEVEYVQATLDFDKNTGEPSEGTGESAEHLMIDNLNMENPTKEDIRRSSEAFIRSCVGWDRNAFTSDLAYEKQKAYVDSVVERLSASLDSIGEIVYLGPQERKDLKTDGVNVIEYAAADHGDAGKEDF